MYIFFIIYISFTLYPAHSRGNRQRESSVKTLPSPFFSEFWRHCVLNSRTQRRALHWPEGRNRSINLNKYFIYSSVDCIHNTSVLQSHFLPLYCYWPLIHNTSYSVLAIQLLIFTYFTYSKTFIIILMSE